MVVEIQVGCLKWATLSRRSIPTCFGPSMPDGRFAAGAYKKGDSVMKRLTKTLILTVFAVGLVLPGYWAEAQSATGQTWTSSITYYTPSGTSGNLTVVYYDGLTTYTAGPFAMNPHAAGSVNIGSTSVPDGFAGSAVLSADVPIVATYVQFAKTVPFEYSRSFYTGFDSSSAGSNFYLATTRANGITTSQIGVQNTDGFEITAKLDFYSVANPTVIYFTHSVDLQPSASYVASVPSIPGYPGGSFDGSLVVTATKLGEPGTPGHVVAVAQETQDTGRAVYGFEGGSSGATLVYIPTAMCRRGVTEQTSYIAAQNTGDSDADVVIDYYDTTGTLVGSMPSTVVAKGAKLSTNPCAQNLLVNTLGSAVIRTTNAQPLVAIGKVASNDGLVTAFVGQSAGALKLAAPYVRWAADAATNFRAYLAIMNVGSAPAESIVVNYYDAAGTLRAAHTVASPGSPLARFTKVNSNPSTAGALVGGSFGYGPNGGAVEIVSDQPVVALVRLVTNPTGLGSVTTLGEDYNGVPIE